MRAKKTRTSRTVKKRVRTVKAKPIVNKPTVKEFDLFRPSFSLSCRVPGVCNYKLGTDVPKRVKEALEKLKNIGNGIPYTINGEDRLLYKSTKISVIEDAISKGIIIV